MPATPPVHITPEGDSWAVKPGESARATSVHPTREQAVTEALALIMERDGAEVVIHGADGRARTSLVVRTIGEDELDEAGDAAIRAEALRITPGNARLKAGIGRRLPVEGVDLDADPADLY